MEAWAPITNASEMPERPNFYVHCPTRTFLMGSTRVGLKQRKGWSGWPVTIGNYPTQFKVQRAAINCSASGSLSTCSGDKIQSSFMVTFFMVSVEVLLEIWQQLVSDKSFRKIYTVIIPTKHVPTPISHGSPTSGEDNRSSLVQDRPFSSTWRMCCLDAYWRSVVYGIPVENNHSL